MVSGAEKKRTNNTSERRREKSMINRYDPFREALSLRHAMDQLLEQSFIHPSLLASQPSVVAPMDIKETSNGYEVDVALPGVRPEDIELLVDQNSLTIRGRYSHQNEQQSQAQGQMQGQAQGQQQAQMQGQQQAQSQAASSQQQGQFQGGQQSGGQLAQQQQGKMQRRQEGQNWLSREIVSGTFERTVTFPRPVDADKIETQYEQGILTVFVPFSEASRPKRIKIAGEQQQQQQKQSTVEAGR
jgi:HSP20 family protein